MCHSCVFSVCAFLGVSQRASETLAPGNPQQEGDAEHCDSAALVPDLSDQEALPGEEGCSYSHTGMLCVVSSRLLLHSDSFLCKSLAHTRKVFGSVVKILLATLFKELPVICQYFL